MANYPYASNPARAKQFFQGIQSIGVPPKVTTVYLESLGYKSKNDRAILPLARSLGFIDASGVPTDVWRKYRNKDQARGVMAEAIRGTYRDLFVTFPDAHRRDNEALRNFFSSHTNLGEAGLRFMVATFKTLTELGDFDAENSREEFAADSGNGSGTGGGSVNGGSVAVADRVAVRPARAQMPGIGSSVTLNVNIQLQIPDTENAETYERFFAAMKKHLLS